MYSFTIQSPLLVFDQVHRETGTIERTCIFTNNTTRDVELEIRYDFSEHSWIQFYGAERGGRDIVDGNALCLQPGENLALLSLNTDNFNFPDTKFRGRVLFADKADRESQDWLEISFEQVEKFKPFVGYAAIDLGTSSSTIALYHVRRDAVSRTPWTPTLEGSESTVPSAVYLENFDRFVRKERSGYLVGRNALRKCRAQPPKDPRCLQLGTKRLIGARRILVTDERSAGGFVDPLDVLYALGRYLRERAQSHPDVHALIQRVNVTYPPTWSYRELNRWRELFRRLGFRDNEVDFSLDEASAAGLFYIYNCVRESDSLKKLVQDLLPTEEGITEDGQRGKSYVLHLLCFDFGGGTTDLALIEAKLQLFEKRLRVRLSLIGSDSYSFGGDQVTLAVFRILKRRLAMALCDPARMHEELAGRPNGGETPPAWAPRRAFLGNDEGEEFLLPDGPSSTFSGLPGEPIDSTTSHGVIRENWGYLCAHLTDESLDTEVEDAVDQLFPTRFLSSDVDPCRIDARRNFDWLWDEAERLKIALLREVQNRHRKAQFPSFPTLKGVRRGISLREVPFHSLAEIPWAAEPAVCESLLSVGADELWSAVAANLRRAVASARALAGSKTIDRVVLSGQSCRMPMVRWLFSSSRGEGGLGIPPTKIEFDEANAKAGVSKGACLLNVMRETLVGFDVDVSDFKANLLSDIFYVEVDGSHRVLFEAGAIDDLAYVEEIPDPRAFPKYLSVFYGSERNLVGQFLLDDDGERLPAVPAAAGEAGLAGRNGGPLTHPEVLELRQSDRDRYVEVVSELLRWTERERIAWMERTAVPGSPSQPCYRFYLTRNHNLFAVRDSGSGAKTLFPLEAAELTFGGPLPHQDPFSGIH